MTEKSVLIYISEENEDCNKLMKQLDEWNVPYEVRNVTENGNYKKELQEKGVYGTPATYIGKEPYAILGFQKEKIRSSLGLADADLNHSKTYSSQ
ncbi:glutaredoxin family protein [Virgibacillus halodenitrificans]|uniref:glutaredoxin family protein n=1 Tax=Virgibacillus halodenitrificans TaxID=1482 RepID=UPI0007614F56